MAAMPLAELVPTAQNNLTFAKYYQGLLSDRNLCCPTYWA
jgi:hypothetical protein